MSKDLISKSWFCVFNNPEEHGYSGSPQEIVDKLTEDLKLAKEKFGKKSEEVADIQRALNIEKRILKTIWQCKNAL